MARLRSSKKSKRLTSRVLVGVLALGAVGFGVYHFDLFAGGEATVAEAPAPEPAVASDPAAWDEVDESAEMQPAGVAAQQGRARQLVEIRLQIRPCDPHKLGT